MPKKNLEIGNALRRSGRENITLLAIIAKTIQENYPKKIDIKSVKIQGNTIVVRTENMLLNSELSLLEGDIKKQALTRLEKIGIILSKDIKFRFL